MNLYLFLSVTDFEYVNWLNLIGGPFSLLLSSTALQTLNCITNVDVRLDKKIGKTTQLLKFSFYVEKLLGQRCRISVGFTFLKAFSFYVENLQD